MIDDIVKMLQQERTEVLNRIEQDQRVLELLESMLKQASVVIAEGSAQRPKPRLDNMRVFEASFAYLTWAFENDIRVTLGDLERELSKWCVMTTRGGPLSETGNPWKSLMNMVGQPQMKRYFSVNKSHRNYRRTDEIRLVISNLQKDSIQK